MNKAIITKPVAIIRKQLTDAITIPLQHFALPSMALSVPIICSLFLISLLPKSRRKGAAAHRIK
jgi:hypothetical protein